MGQITFFFKAWLRRRCHWAEACTGGGERRHRGAEAEIQGTETGALTSKFPGAQREGTCSSRIWLLLLGCGNRSRNYLFLFWDSLYFNKWVIHFLELILVFVSLVKSCRLVARLSVSVLCSCSGKNSSRVSRTCPSLDPGLPSSLVNMPLCQCRIKFQMDGYQLEMMYDRIWELGGIHKDLPKV